MIQCAGRLVRMGRGVTTLYHQGQASFFLLPAAILNHMTMLSLITEKLQNQTLDDATSSSATSARTKLQVKDEAVRPAVSTSDASLAVKGKNVWGMPLKSLSPGSGRSSKGDGGGGGRPKKSCDKHVSVVLCSHRKAPHKCLVCDAHSSVAPPKKKHCRSLSVPVDSMTSWSWQPEGAKLLRPIPVIPLTNNNNDQQNRNIESDFKSTCRSATRFVQSPLSMDSGHYTTSDFQTPPGSPVPRPVSALSDFSQSSFGAPPWLEHSPYRNRFGILQNRSLSYEEQIPLGAGSTPCMSDSVTLTSNPSSPYRHKIPRCRSQPCVLHDRRQAKKRRRDDCRPTLNFQKMTETAYVRVRRSDPLRTPAIDAQKRSYRFHTELESAMNLMPIASSPRDTDIPSRKLSDTYQPITEFAGVASLGLPPTPPQSTTCTSCSGFDIQQPVRLIGDDEGSECGCRGDNLEDESTGLFPLTDLDIEQIENH